MSEQATKERRLAKLREYGLRMPHGTYGRYTVGCRCEACHEARRRHYHEKNGQPRKMVDAAPVRAHLRKLSKYHHIGSGTIEEVTKLHASHIDRIRRGVTTRVKKETADLILAVKPTLELEARGDHNLVPAGRTWRLLDELIGLGYTRRQLAGWMGHKVLRISRVRVRVSTEWRVRRLYDDLQAGRISR